LGRVLLADRLPDDHPRGEGPTPNAQDRVRIRHQKPWNSI
jgi:hypothetical protein